MNPCLEYTVRFIYFKPINIQPAPINKVKQLVKNIQFFYANEMNRYGYGQKTFKVELDENNEIVIHIVDGEHNKEHYAGYVEKTSLSIKKELPEKIDKNVYVILVDGIHLINDSVLGVAWTYEREFGGCAYVPARMIDDQLNGTSTVTAHEIGHTFGLYENILKGDFLMGKGHKHLSGYEARWLDKSHFFNNVHNINSPPKVIKKYPIEYIGDNIRIQVDIESVAELHQAQVFRRSHNGIIGWDYLIGKRATAKFEIHKSKLINNTELIIQVMDINGNHKMYNIVY